MHTSGPRPDVHLELHTGDQARASAFYANLLGWRRLIEAGCGSYLALDLGGGFGGGMVECGAVRLVAPPEGPAGWRRVTSAPSAASSLPGSQTNDHQA